MGRPGPAAAYTDIDPTRTHLRLLVAAGFTRDAIAAAAQLAPTTIKAYLREHATPKGEAALTMIHRVYERRILAIDPTNTTLRGDGIIDGAAASRRMQALIAIGWTRGMLSAHLDTNIRGSGWPRGIRGSVNTRLAALYERAAHSRPPYANQVQATRGRDAAIEAARLGWLRPDDWIDIDAGVIAWEPTTESHRSVDDILDGRAADLSETERDLAILLMQQRGDRHERIAARLGIPGTTLLYMERRLERTGATPDSLQACIEQQPADIHRRRYGVANAALIDVPIDDVRTHLAALTDAGASHQQIATATGVSVDSLRAWASPSRGVRYVRTALAGRLIAMTAEQARILSTTAPVATTATLRRLQALAVVGYTRSMIAAAAGVPTKLVHDIHAARQTRVPREVEQSIAAAYSARALVPPVYSNDIERRYGERAARDAAALGWLGPLDWEDIEAGTLDAWEDDADAATIDPVAVELAIAGDAVALTEAERLEVVRQMLARGHGPTKIAERLRISGATYSDLVGRLNPASQAA